MKDRRVGVKESWQWLRVYRSHSLQNFPLERQLMSFVLVFFTAVLSAPRGKMRRWRSVVSVCDG